MSEEKVAKLGQQLTKETKEKITQNHAHYWLGKKRPIEAIRKTSETFKKRALKKYSKGKRFCPSCDQFRELSEFYKDRSVRDGLSCYCKTCKSIYGKTRLRENREHVTALAKKNRVKRRLKVLQMISRLETPICSNCGCDFIPILEINHMNGEGYSEYREVTISLARRVMNGTREMADLNVLCRPCNDLEYINRKYGNIPLKIVWEGE